MAKYTSKRGQQDEQRDDLALKLAALLPELAAVWDGDGTLDVATITCSRSKAGEGALGIIKGTVLEDGEDPAAVEQFGGQGVIAYGFGEDVIAALASLEVLLARGELQLQPDRYAAGSKAAGPAKRRVKQPKTHKGD